MSAYRDILAAHYSREWNGEGRICNWLQGPIHQLPIDFHILEFAPTPYRNHWTYATCGMSIDIPNKALELHVFAPGQCEGLVELLTFVVHYHRTGHLLGLAHTVNFGRPWWEGSRSEYGLISLPYLDGPNLEILRDNEARIDIKCLWLIPITLEERNYKKEYGLEKLEQRFDSVQPTFEYANPFRTSVVP